MRATLIIGLMMVSACFHQEPVWAQNQESEATQQVYQMQPGTAERLAPDFYQAQAFNPAPDIMGKDPFNDFVMVSGGLSYLVFYGTDITLIAMCNFTNAFQIFALWSALILPIFPSLAYFLRGKYEQGF